MGETDRVVRLLLGIGNPAHGDDGAGNYVAGLVRSPHWKVFDCGTVPEMFTGKIRALHPELLVMVDAADIGLSPGEFRRVPPERISGLSAGTHGLPLSVMIEYVRPLAGQILFIGIQPGQMADEDRLSDPVRNGADRLAGIITRGSFEEIPELEG